jgi:hypothetical protein
MFSSCCVIGPLQCLNLGFQFDETAAKEAVLRQRPKMIGTEQNDFSFKFSSMLFFQTGLLKFHCDLVSTKQIFTMNGELIQIWKNNCKVWVV